MAGMRPRLWNRPESNRRFPRLLPEVGTITHLSHIPAGRPVPAGPVCPGCHALLTSALPPCSPYGGAVFPAVKE